jgi:sulfate adenylyltransferase large subunit
LDYSSDEKKTLLRVLICGSVDHGKSSLIGRLLYDSHVVYEDQLDSIKTETSRFRGGSAADLSLLVDGLQSEKELGITIDVAHRYFSTTRRSFILIDTPGHEQYTRNMVTGASNSDVAVILIDAKYGLQLQTRRHGYIASLLGIKKFIIAVNKMDLVGFGRDRFEKICFDCKTFFNSLSDVEVCCIPVSALSGDNVVSLSSKMPWFQTGTLISMLEETEICSENNSLGFRLPIQYVHQISSSSRGFCGTLASGVVRKGDAIKMLPSNKTGIVKAILTYEEELDCASAGMAITLTFDSDIEASRGDICVHDSRGLIEGRKIDCTVVWMVNNPLNAGVTYDLKIGTRICSGKVSAFHSKLELENLTEQPTSCLSLNEIGKVSIDLDEVLVFDLYEKSRIFGGFIFIDRETNETTGAGMISG